MKIPYRNDSYESIKACLEDNGGTYAKYQYYRKQGCSRKKAIDKACKAPPEGTQYTIHVIVDGKRIFKATGDYDAIGPVKQCVEKLADRLCKFAAITIEVKT